MNKNRRTDIPIHKAKIDSRIGISTKYGERITITLYMDIVYFHTNIGHVHSCTKQYVLHEMSSHGAFTKINVHKNDIMTSR